MPAELHTSSSLKIGDRCIIFVNSVNSPQGWWWGKVESLTPSDRCIRCTARITGPFAFDSRNDPIFDAEERTPNVNYSVYAITADTIDLIRALIYLSNRRSVEAEEARIRLDAAKEIIRSTVKTFIQEIAAVEAKK